MVRTNLPRSFSRKKNPVPRSSGMTDPDSNIVMEPMPANVMFLQASAEIPLKLIIKTELFRILDTVLERIKAREASVPARKWELA